MLHYNPLHVSSINMPIFRRTNFIIKASGIVTLCKRLYIMPDESSAFSVTQVDIFKIFSHTHVLYYICLPPHILACYSCLLCPSPIYFYCLHYPSPVCYLCSLILGLYVSLVFPIIGLHVILVSRSLVSKSRPKTQHYLRKLQSVLCDILNCSHILSIFYL